MSLGPLAEPVAEGVVIQAPWSRLLAYVALFLRLASGRD